MNNLEKIIRGLLKARIRTRANLVNVKRQLSNRQNLPPPLNSDLIKIYRQLRRKEQIKEDKILERLLRKREIRTLSGVAVITVLTKPYPCPGNCVYCPTEKGMPKSYLKNEPAAARAFAAKFDPFSQVKVRIGALENNGHNTDKVELIVLGGSWSAYPKNYQTWFIKRCFDALNGKTAKNLRQAQKWNEGAKHRCVGLTLETRPDLITENEIKRMRELGCTRVELGVQSIFNPILKLNKRGHTVKQVITATKLLKQAGFKITYHMMPNLPGSTPQKDLKMFKEIFSNPDFQPDQLKIYPCVVIKNTELYSWHRKGRYRPYSETQLKNLLIKIKKTIPSYVRIIRLIRDIPKESIIAGNIITNLRQIIAEKNPNLCRCIRCREAGHNKNSKFKILPAPACAGRQAGQNSKLNIKKYKASEGIEYFISYDSKDGKILYAFLRLRINDDLKNNFVEELKGTAIIRELHTYGELVPIGKKNYSRGFHASAPLTQEKIQHLGLGKRLLAQAESICRKEGVKKIAVISGIGVREYYQKLGYQLQGTYMIKTHK